MIEAAERHPKRAVMLLSGGLDSTLAARMMADQGVELFALHFTSPFCTCAKAAGNGCSSQAQVVAGRLGIPIRTVSKGPEYLEIIRNPKHGRGAGMNPCIDCRIFTLRRAREHMEQVGASFLVTGEVVGQRPMSQRFDAIRIIEKHSGCRGLVLRPLSAKHFEPTLPEREGWIDREKLLGITGRSRKEQIRLARKWDVVDYPCPAGGCLLAEKSFSLKVRDLFDHCAAPDMADIHLLKVGRHFRLCDGRKAIVARNEEENRKLEALCRGKMPVYVAHGFSGPSIGIEANHGAAPEDVLSRLFTRYSKPGTPPPFPVREVGLSGERELLLPGNPDGSGIDLALLG
jgi:tRNA U34 2-thiouridine synthase MnmA/TrmU